MDIPLCTSVIVGPWSVYSCKTSNHDDRCLVIKDCRYDSPSTICLHHLCKQARAVMVNSSSSSLFTCEDHWICCSTRKTVLWFSWLAGIAVWWHNEEWFVETQGVIRKSTISCESFSFNVLSLDMSHQIILPGIAMWRCSKMPSDVVLRTAKHLLQRQNKTKPKIYAYTFIY